MDIPSAGVGWVEMQRAMIRVLGIQVGNPRGSCCRFRDDPGLRQAAFSPPPTPPPPPPATHTHTLTRLLSFLFTELFLILISGGLKAKITMKGKSAS